MRAIVTDDFHSLTPHVIANSRYHSGCGSDDKCRALASAR